MENWWVFRSCKTFSCRKRLYVKSVLACKEDITTETSFTDKKVIWKENYPVHTILLLHIYCHWMSFMLIVIVLIQNIG